MWAERRRVDKHGVTARRRNAYFSSQRDAIPPYRITKQAPFLRHFTAHFAQGGNAGAAGFLP
jgi:hypothetical protein